MREKISLFFTWGHSKRLASTNQGKGFHQEQNWLAPCSGAFLPLKLWEINASCLSHSVYGIYYSSLILYILLHIYQRILQCYALIWELPRWYSGKESACQCRWQKRWTKEAVGYNPWDCKESDKTEHRTCFCLVPLCYFSYYCHMFYFYMCLKLRIHFYYFCFNKLK